MNTWQSLHVATNGIRLHVTRTGGDKPPLVLAHGITDDGLCWSPIAEALATSYDVIMVDARGHGRSDAPDGGYDAATQAADLAAVITELGLDRPAVLGHSMGALTALALAGLAPELPAVIVLEDPPAAILVPREATPQDRERWIELRDWISGLARAERDELIAAQRAANPLWSEAELAPWADAKLRVSQNVLSLFAGGDRAPIDWATTSRAITCPALLITADPERGGLVTPNEAETLQRMIRGLSVVRISDAGHNIRRDQPARYLEIVTAFLAAHMLPRLDHGDGGA